MTTENTNYAKIGCLKFPGYKIELDENHAGKPVARRLRFITVGKNKGQYKNEEGYYFPTEARRSAWIAEQIVKIKDWISAKAARTTAKKEIRANMVNPFKVGDVYYDSWGYEQTNIDFYLVTEVKARSVVIVRIGAKSVEGTAGHDSINVVPNLERIIGAPELKQVQFYINGKNETVYYIKSRHGWISKYDRGEKGVYSSWGY